MHVFGSRDFGSDIAIVVCCGRAGSISRSVRGKLLLGQLPKMIFPKPILFNNMLFPKVSCVMLVDAQPAEEVWVLLRC